MNKLTTKRMPKKELPIASLTVRRISGMSEVELKKLINWIEAQAATIKAKHYRPGFSARYIARLF